MGVMNGLQSDLKDKILVGSPDLRVLNYGDDIKIGNWPAVLDESKRFRASSRPRHSSSRRDWSPPDTTIVEPAQIAGIEPQGPHVPDVTTIRQHADTVAQGDFRFASSDGHTRGVVLGRLLADRLERSARATPFTCWHRRSVGSS